MHPGGQCLIFTGCHLQAGVSAVPLTSCPIIVSGGLLLDGVVCDQTMDPMIMYPVLYLLAITWSLVPVHRYARSHANGSNIL